MIKTNNDLSVGMVVVVKNGDQYVVVADDNGSHDVINLSTGKSTGIEVGTGKIAVAGGNSKGGRDAVAVYEFQALPSRNRLSEALKILSGAGTLDMAKSFPSYRNPFTAKAACVWTAEDPALTRAKARVADLSAALSAANAEVSRLSR